MSFSHASEFYGLCFVGVISVGEGAVGGVDGFQYFCVDSFLKNANFLGVVSDSGVGEHHIKLGEVVVDFHLALLEMFKAFSSFLREVFVLESGLDSSFEVAPGAPCWRICRSAAIDEFLNKIVSILSSHEGEGNKNFLLAICDSIAVKEDFEFALELSIVFIRTIIDCGGVEFDTVC